MEDIGHGGISKYGGGPQEIVLEGRLGDQRPTLLACWPVKVVEVC